MPHYTQVVGIILFCCPCTQFVWHGQCPDAWLGVGHQLGAALVHTHLMEHEPRVKPLHRLPSLRDNKVVDNKQNNYFQTFLLLLLLKA